MKSIAYSLFLALFLSAGFASQAGAECGGSIVPENDCNNNGRSWHFSCCPDGYRVQGVAYNDLKKQDHVDAVSAVCRSISRGNDIMPQDFGRSPKTFVCDKQEVMAGIYSKDVLTEGGDKYDELDGLTAICQHPGSKELRKVYNYDIQGGREGREKFVYLPKRVVGIAYKELEKGSSDRADCVAIIVK